MDEGMYWPEILDFLIYSRIAPESIWTFINKQTKKSPGTNGLGRFPVQLNLQTLMR